MEPLAASSVHLGTADNVRVISTVNGDVVVTPATPCPTHEVIFALTAAVLYSAGIINVPPL